MFVLFLILLIVLSALIIYRRLYFAPVAVARIFPAGIELTTFKPCKKSFVHLSGNHNYCFVSVAPGIVAFYVDRLDEPAQLFYNDIMIHSDVYLFRISKGRFKNIDMTDRLLLDSIKKFIIV